MTEKGNRDSADAVAPRAAFDEVDRDRLRMSAAATPAQRLAWLEDMMRWAARFAKRSPSDIEAGARRAPVDRR